MKELIINGQVIRSIWKTDKPAVPSSTTDEPKKKSLTAEKHSEKRERNRNQNPYNHHGYYDPTASAALKNIMREERETERRNSQGKKRKRKKQVKPT